MEKEQSMLLLSVMIEYSSAQDIATYYSQLNPIIETYLKSDLASLKRLAVITVNNLTQSGHAVKVLQKYPNLIPLVLNAIDLEQEDLIQKIFETATVFKMRISSICFRLVREQLTTKTYYLTDLSTYIFFFTKK